MQIIFKEWINDYINCKKWLKSFSFLFKVFNVNNIMDCNNCIVKFDVNL
jgi:hypothetical protein